MKKVSLLIPFVIGVFIVNAQNVGIGTTTPAGKLHIKGAANISQLTIDANATQTNTNPLIKIRRSDGTALMWIHSDDSTNTFIGHNTGRVNNITGGLNNTFLGSGAGQFNTVGTGNTAGGFRALYTNTLGFLNTAFGGEALSANTDGDENTAGGYYALRSNTIGNDNVAIGFSALSSNTTANQNTGIGTSALFFQSFDNGGEVWISANTAVGFQALYANQPTETFTGVSNTAIGYAALRNNTVGSHNTASGSSALLSNTLGFGNTASGYNALNANTSGYYNTASGFEALKQNTTAARNVAIGKDALYTQSFANGGSAWNSQNTAVGYEALRYNQPASASSGVNNTAVGTRSLYLNTTGASNTAIGVNALDNNVDGFANIAIGFGAGTAAGSLYNTISIGNYGWLNGFQNQAFIGNESTAWIGGWVNWSKYSDARIKNNIKEDVKGLDFIIRLRPVTYYSSIKAMKDITGNKETEDYPGKYDVEKVKNNGFLAQEVEKAAQESGYDFSGVHKPKNEHDLYSLSYADFVMPLVKGMQEQQAIIEEQNKKIELLLKEIQLIKDKLK
jgi:hypothetical protein